MITCKSSSSSRGAGLEDSKTVFGTERMGESVGKEGKLSGVETCSDSMSETNCSCVYFVNGSA